MKINDFLKKKHIQTADDLGFQLQLFAYTVAKHYGISLREVYMMEESMFKQSLAWAMAVEHEREEAEKKERLRSSSGSDEVVDFDYTFLEMEEY